MPVKKNLNNYDVFAHTYFHIHIDISIQIATHHICINNAKTDNPAAFIRANMLRINMPNINNLSTHISPRLYFNSTHLILNL